jgi:shikimate dehydrogenase
MNLFGLIGFPLAHSFSPAYFKDKFQREGLTDYRYEAFPLSSIQQLPEFLSQHPDLGGFNVTIPYKEAIIPYLDELDDAAAEIGAVNCVKIHRDIDINNNCQLSTINCQLEKNFRLKGYNTDAPAFAQCLQEGWTLPTKALVFGTGGAAKAVAYALKQLHIDFYFVSRSKREGQTITYFDLSQDILKSHPLWINATPVGMFPHTEESLPLDYSLVGSEHYLFDLIYNPEETLFLRRGREHGAHIKNGLPMLHTQAELSWKVLNNLSDY